MVIALDYLILNATLILTGFEPTTSYTMAQAYYASCVPTQPLDKISLQMCYLYSFPSYLQFIVPFVNVFQAMDFKEENSIKIYDINYHAFLSFLQKCCVIYLNPEKPTQDLSQSTPLQNVNLTFAYNNSSSEFTFSIEDNQVKFLFNHQLFPNLISAISRLLFKTYGYSHNINFLITQYLKLAPVPLIQNPTFTQCQEIFHQLEAPFIDFFLLFEIVQRHKKVLSYLKLFETFQK